MVIFDYFFRGSQKGALVVHLLVILGGFGEHFGMILGAFWEASGIIMGGIRCCCKLFAGSLADPLAGNSSGTLFHLTFFSRAPRGRGFATWIRAVPWGHAKRV